MKMNTNAKRLVGISLSIGILAAVNNYTLAQELKFKVQKLQTKQHPLQTTVKKLEPIISKLLTKKYSKRPEHVINISNHPSLDSRPVISGDGTVIAFESKRDGNYEIYVADLKIETLTNISNHKARDIMPSISYDGSIVAFYSMRRPSGIYVANLREKIFMNISFISDYNVGWQTSISADGTKIAFSGVTEREWTGQRWKRNTDVYVADLRAKTLTNISSNKAYDGKPSISADGTKVAFVSDRDGNNEVYLAGLKKKTLINLSNNEEWDGLPELGYYEDGVLFLRVRAGKSEVYTANPDSNTFRPANDLFRQILERGMSISKDGRRGARSLRLKDGQIEENSEVYLIKLDKKKVIGGSTLKICPQCKGTGLVKCNMCGGSRQVKSYPGFMTRCPLCKGTGKLKCPACNGKGKATARAKEQYFTFAGLWTFR